MIQTDCLWLTVNGGGGIRTPGAWTAQRFSRPPLKNDNSANSKDLRKAETGAYKPAYKENPKKAENQANSMPPELAKIVQVWPGLPEHIKTAIKALVQTHKTEKSK